MIKRWVVGVAIVVVAVAVMVWGAASSSSDSDYRDTALSVARDGLSAVRTVTVLTDMDALGTYQARAVKDAQSRLTDAADELEHTERPSAAATALYQRLSPLLTAAVDAVGHAVDERGLTDVRGSLRRTGDGLADVVRSLQ